MYYILSEIDNQVNNLYIKKEDVSFDTFYKVSVLYYKTLEKTLKRLENRQNHLTLLNSQSSKNIIIDMNKKINCSIK